MKFVIVKRHEMGCWPCIRCPPPGRGKRTATWDFSRLQKYRSSGIRDQHTGRKRPLCREDFLDFYTNQCPRYQRVLAQERLAHQTTHTFECSGLLRMI